MTQKLHNSTPNDVVEVGCEFERPKKNRKVRLATQYNFINGAPTFKKIVPL